MTAAPRRGRRPGAPDTRAAILQAARESFGQKGLAGTSVRAVATRAGVDAALIHHYFGSKDDLFLAAMELPMDLRAVLGRVVVGGVDGVGERLLRAFLAVWDDPELTPVLVGRARQMLEPGGERLLGQGLVPVVFGPAGEVLGVDAPEVRMALVVSQMVGLILTRYVLAVEPLASMAAEQVVAVYAPTVQRYLTGDLPT